MLKLRQRLLPYLYTLFDECNRTGAPILRPLFWAYPDDTATYAQDDEVLCGDALLIAPITRPGIEYRHVYLPAGSWFHFWSDKRIDGPTHQLAHAPLGEPAIYMRANTAVPLWPEMNYVGQEPVETLTLLLYPCEGRGQATLYEDAGDGYEQENGIYARRTILCEMEADTIRVLIGAQEGTFVPPYKQFHLELRAITTEPHIIVCGKRELSWQYDAAQRSVTIAVEATAAEIDVSIEL